MLWDQDPFPEMFRMVDGKKTSLEITAIQYDQLLEQQMEEIIATDDGIIGDKKKEYEVQSILQLAIDAEIACTPADSTGENGLDSAIGANPNDHVEPILITDEGELNVKKEGKTLLRHIMRLSTFGILEEVAKDIRLQETIDEELRLTSYRKKMRQTLIREQKELDEGVRPVEIHNRRISEIHENNSKELEDSIYEDDDQANFGEQQPDITRVDRIVSNRADPPRDSTNRQNARLNDSPIRRFGNS